jgi:hypothetical protein
VSIPRLLQCAIALLVALPLYGFADSFNVKTGAWEMSTTTIAVETQTRESVTTKGDVALDGSGGKMHVEGHGRWLGASCAGIEQGN